MKGGSQRWCAPGRSRAFTPATSRGLTRQHQVGGGQRALDGAMAEPRRALGAARRVRGLGDHIGNAERAGHDRAQPVGLAVVAMIGEPEVEAFGMAGRQARASARSAAAPARARGVRAPGDARIGTPGATRLSARHRPRCGRAGAAGARGRAPSRDRPRRSGLSGGFSGVCNSTRMVNHSPRARISCLTAAG